MRMHATYRRFDGKRYRMHSEYPAQSGAKIDQKKFKDAGYLTRIVHFKRTALYVLYVRINPKQGG